MKRLLYILVTLFIVCCSNNGGKYKEEIIDYDTLYDGYIYRHVIRHYDYSYNEDKNAYYEEYIDSLRFKGIHVNEFGDTVQIDYATTINFPRREE